MTVLIDRDMLLSELTKMNDFGELTAKKAIRCVRNCPVVNQWIPCSERMPDIDFQDRWKNKTIFELYPVLVTRKATHSAVDKERNYVCKSYYDGKDFMLHGGYNYAEKSDNVNTIAWMPLPEAYKEEK